MNRSTFFSNVKIAGTKSGVHDAAVEQLLDRYKNVSEKSSPPDIPHQEV